MRSQDVGIGLAMAWAAQRDEDVVSRGAGVRHLGRSAELLTWSSERLQWDALKVDRGPVVEPEPLTDTRVAFGIAMAHAGPWKDSGWSTSATVTVRSRDRLVYVRVQRLLVRVWSDRTRLPKYPDNEVDLDTRQWPGRSAGV